MNKTNNILKSLCLLSLLISSFVSCSDDEYEIPGSFVDLSITMTSGAAAERESEVNRFFSFSDISAGAEYSEWRIPNSAFFLEGPIPNNLDNHDAYIAEPSNRKVSSEKTVHVLWKKGDSLTKVGYFGVFPDSTSFRFPAYWDSDLGENVEDTIKTVKRNGKWVAEYWFNIDVYDTVVATPQVRYLDETILNHNNTQTVTLTFGDKLIFEDLSGLLENNNARPNTTVWRMHTTEANEEDQTNAYRNSYTRTNLRERVIDTITFDELGEFKVELTATRERTDNLKQSQNTYNIPTIFNVIPLTEPLEQTGTIVETDMDIVEVTLSHKIMPLEGAVVDNFLVEVDGVAKTITAITRNANGTKLLIDLSDDPILPEDDGKTVVVSYDGASSLLKSFDERPLEPFSNLPIQVYVPTPTDKIGSIVETNTDVIQVTFNQDLNPDSVANATNPATGFSIMLNGSAATISSVAVNATNPAILEFTISEGVYQDDVITVAYTGPGEIKTVGGGSIANFAADTVEPYIENLFTDGSFEGTLGDYWFEGASGTGAIVEFSTDQAFDGAQSVKLTNDKPRLESGRNLNYEAGETYIISYRRYIPASVDFEAGFRAADAGEKIWFDLGNGNAAVTPRWFTNGDPVKDSWELVEVEITPGAVSNVGIRFQPVPTSGTVYTLYFDDFKVYKKEYRP
ncbi:hypothetical protein FUA26_02205 [Seonamhaeicola algicola]|uniref:CBM-cenC domain-containing protein n=1 Tax=Seonamhaeicola algicola TaxID=1719036 RepID=A0A5C7AZH5_9FLAO|nr:SwmB domain-containing protein [Seonamhaeicola algicola]TXE13911.1 hypothetical protein FUA26_02205 [Seonamhaeicola algicola]